jgi:hypothetical protein
LEQSISIGFYNIKNINELNIKNLDTEWQEEVTMLKNIIVKRNNEGKT